MKIGFVVDDHLGRPGGVQEYVRGLRQFLEEQGHTCVVFSGGGGPPEPAVIPLGVSLPLRGNGSDTSIPLALAPPKILRRLLAEEACDILHVMAPYSPTLSGRLLVHSRAAHVMTFLVAVEPPWFLRALGILALAQRRSLLRFHARIAISQAARRSAKTLYGGEYQIIPVGMELERFRPPQRRLGGDGGLVTILYLGRLEQRKGVRLLLQAFARLRRQTPSVRLCIAGNGPERLALERQARELGLHDVQFAGYVPPDDLPCLLHGADIFCAPATHGESFGLVLVEALAAGLPIVAAANQGYAELLGAHPGNLLVPPGDDRALAGALQILAAAPAYRSELGRRNMAAAERYSWRMVGAAVLEAYERAIMAAQRQR